MIRIRGHEDGDLAWIEGRAGVVLTRDARAVVAEEDGQIVGMVAYDSWTENAAMAHMAVSGPRIWTKLLRPAFQYVFEQAGKGLLLGVIPEHNPRSLRFTRGVGFRLAYVIQDGWAVGDSLFMFTMRREECRWIRRH